MMWNDMALCTTCCFRGNCFNGRKLLHGNEESTTCERTYLYKDRDTQSARPRATQACLHVSLHLLVQLRLVASFAIGVLENFSIAAEHAPPDLPTRFVYRSGVLRINLSLIHGLQLASYSATIVPVPGSAWIAPRCLRYGHFEKREDAAPAFRLKLEKFPFKRFPMTKESKKVYRDDSRPLGFRVDEAATYTYHAVGARRKPEYCSSHTLSMATMSAECEYCSIRARWSG